MFQKKGNLQLELFTGPKDSPALKNAAPGNYLLNNIWNYEKTIIIIMGLVITGIISFSLGVKKGKKLALPLRGEVAIPKEQVHQITIKKEEIIKPPLPTEQPGYTIQLASYKTKTYAEKEAQLLRKKGFVPLVLVKGSYTILCVGSFSNKETAQPLLAKLKKRYNSCYVRRL